MTWSGPPPPWSTSAGPTSTSSPASPGSCWSSPAPPTSSTRPRPGSPSRASPSSRSTRDRGPPPAEPRLPAPPGRAAAVGHRLPVGAARLPAAGAGPHWVGGQGGSGRVRARPGLDAVGPARRDRGRPLGPATADAGGRRPPRARRRRPGRGGRGRPARLLGDRRGRVRRGRRDGPVPGRAGRRPAGRGAGTPAAGGGGHPDRPAGGSPARRPAPRRRALRARPRHPVPGRRRLLRLLDRLAAGHAHAVPGGAPAGWGVAAVAARRGVPLPLEPPVPAHLRVPVRAGELHRRRDPAGAGRPRRAPGAVGRPGRRAGRRRRRLPAARLVPVAAGPAAAPGPRGAAAGAVDLVRLRPVPGLAERVRADRQHPAHVAGHPGDQLGGPRLSDRDDARPAARPDPGRLEHGLAADHAARSAGRRGPAGQPAGAGRDRLLRPVRARAGHLGHAQPVDPGGAEPGRARPPPRVGQDAGGAAVGSGPAPSPDGRETPAGALEEPITGTTWRAVMISSTMPYSRAWSALMMKSRSVSLATFSTVWPVCLAMISSSSMRRRRISRAWISMSTDWPRAPPDGWWIRMVEWGRA